MDASYEGNDAYALTFVCYVGNLYTSTVLNLKLIRPSLLYFAATSKRMGSNGRIFHRSHTIIINGRQTLIMDVAPSAVWMHCMITHEQLTAEELSPDLGDVLQ